MLNDVVIRETGSTYLSDEEFEGLLTGIRGPVEKSSAPDPPPAELGLYPGSPNVCCAHCASRNKRNDPCGDGCPVVYARDLERAQRKAAKKAERGPRPVPDLPQTPSRLGAFMRRRRTTGDPHDRN